MSFYLLNIPILESFSQKFSKTDIFVRNITDNRYILSIVCRKTAPTAPDSRNRLAVAYVIVYNKINV